MLYTLSDELGLRLDVSPTVTLGLGPIGQAQDRVGVYRRLRGQEKLRKPPLRVITNIITLYVGHTVAQSVIKAQAWQVYPKRPYTPCLCMAKFTDHFTNVRR